MSNASPSPRVAPRLLRRERAAGYLDVSPTTFDKLVRDGVIPAAKRLATMKVWDRADLDLLADQLPYDAQASQPDDTWDD